MLSYADIYVHLRTIEYRQLNFFLTLDQLLYGRLFPITPFAESPFFHPDDILEVRLSFNLGKFQMQEKNTLVHSRSKGQGFLGKLDKYLEIKTRDLKPLRM